MRPNLTCMPINTCNIFYMQFKLSTLLRCSNRDICTCKTCPVFSRLVDFESCAQELFAQRKTENIIITKI